MKTQSILSESVSKKKLVVQLQYKEINQIIQDISGVFPYVIIKGIPLSIMSYNDCYKRKIGDVEVEIVLDDEGLLIDKPKISAIDITGTPMLAGNLLVASGRVTEDGELTELTQEEIDEIMDNIATITTSVYKEPYPVFVEMNY